MPWFRASGPAKAGHYMTFCGLGLALSLAIACGHGIEKPVASNVAPTPIQLEKHFADRKVGTSLGSGGSHVGSTLEQLLTREQ